MKKTKKSKEKNYPHAKGRGSKNSGSIRGEIVSTQRTVIFFGRGTKTTTQQGQLKVIHKSRPRGRV